MKHILILITFIVTTLTSQAQWVTKVVNNGIDEPYRIAYCSNTTKTAVLKLEKTDSMEVAFYLTGGYHCDESTTADLGLTVGQTIKRYTFSVYTSEDKRTVFILDNIYYEDETIGDEFFKDFKKCSKLSIRINESHCTDDYYQFNMTGSVNALQFISK